MFGLKIFRQVLVIIVVVGCGGSELQAQKKKIRQPSETVNQSIAAAQNDLTAKGIEAFNRGEAETARKLFEQALKSNASDWQANNYLGILEDRSGDLKSAEIHIGRAARLNPKSAAMRNNYGAILLKLNRTKEAAMEFGASLKIDSQQPNALINLAQIRFNENTPAALQSSFDLFKKAAALVKDSAVERAIVVIALRLNNKPEAARYYQTYAASLFGQQTVLPDASSRAELGGALFEAGLFAEAETELKAALAADSSNSEAVVSLGRVFLARRDFKSAGVLLETAVFRKQATAAIYSLLAIVYEKTGHYENAIPAMRLAIGLKPESETYRFQYGLLLANADAPAAAIIRLNEALKEFPNSPRLWLALGIVNLKDNRNNDAAQAIGKAIELDPKFAQAFAYLGLARMQMGDIAAAIKYYENALAVDANLAVVHQMIADAMLQQTDSDAARIEAELKKSVALVPDFLPARLTLGKLYMRLQRWTEAAAELNEVVRVNPESAEAFYQLSRIYVRLKQKPEADAALKKFKELSETQKTKSETELRETVRRLADVRF